MTAIDDIRRSVSAELDSVNHSIVSALASGNALMDQVIANYLRVSGKQLRPLMVLLTARLLRGDMECAVTAATAVELLHNASLIHDDVVDDSSQRHGVATINALWDSHIAVLVGDYFVSIALAQAVKTADLRIIQAIARLGTLLSVGEMDQIHTARQHSLALDDYFDIISHKTASLFVACARMGCYAAGVDDERLDAMTRFAELFGRAFQIKDDTFDYYDDPAVGKPTGNDLREGKVTLPLLHALSQTSHPRHGEMAALAAKPRLDDGEIATLVEFAKECGGIDEAYRVMRGLRDQAARAVEPLGPGTGDLLRLFDFVIQRDH